MKLEIPEAKVLVYPVRFSKSDYEKIKKIAKENNTKIHSVIQAIIKKGMRD